MTGLVVALAVALLFGGSLLLFGWHRFRRLERSIDALVRDLQTLDLDHDRRFDVRDQSTGSIRALRRALEDAFARARHAVSVEKRFVATASHEIRTSLAAAHAQAQVGMITRSVAESAWIFSAIVRDLDRASRLFSQLLDLALIDGGLDRESGHHLSLSRLVDEVRQELDHSAQRKQISIVTRIDTDVVFGNELGLHLALRNLLANSISYCPSGSTVLVTSRGQDGGVLVSIEDSGPGIPLDRRESAFEPFNRLGRTGGDGVGLGLAIVLRIIEVHRGRIALSDAAGGGLQVDIWLPTPAGRRDSPAA